MEKCLSNNQPLSGAISPTQLASIIDIAYQCPSAGGTAVYRARAMYSIVNDTIVYDDYEACWNVNINWRQGNTNNHGNLDVLATDNFFTYPNPASGSLYIEYGTMYYGATYSLINTLGQTVKAIVLSDEGKTEVKVNDLAQGIYILKGNITNNKPLRIIIE